ncbi:MAG: hypothetical protein LBQ30_09855 [Treponema sp.]|nr:hypothetical protein [Treponema sp.]
MYSRQEIYRTSWREYQRAAKQERGAILDRLVLTTGINRDYLATTLRNYQAQTGGKAGRGIAKHPGLIVFRS